MENINNILSAHDTVLISESLDDLQAILNQVVEISVEQGLILNFKKTKFMTITKLQQWQESLWIQAEQTVKVEKYKYLSTIVNKSNDCTEKIGRRISRARNVFNKMKTVLAEILN